MENPNKHRLILPKRRTHGVLSSEPAHKVQKLDEVVPPKSRRRQPKWRQISEQEWKNIKPKFEQLYVVNDLPLKDVIILLGVDGFIASLVIKLLSANYLVDRLAAKLSTRSKLLNGSLTRK